MKKLLLTLVAFIAFAGLCAAQNPVCSAVIVSQGSATGWLCPVDATTGVTAGLYAKWNSAGTALVVGATTDTAGLIVGIAATTQVGGYALFYTTGSASALFDGATTAGDYFGVSTSTAGKFHDVGANGNSQSWGRVTATIGSTGQAGLWIIGHVPEAIPVLISTSGPVADPGGANSYEFNNSAGGLTFNLPAGVPGMQRCYRNATGKSGAITIAVTTSNAIDKDGANGTTTTGTLVSGGALGDAVCLVSDAVNHWYAYPSKGAWTNN